MSELPTNENANRWDEIERLTAERDRLAKIVDALIEYDKTLTDFAWPAHDAIIASAKKERGRG